MKSLIIFLMCFSAACIGQEVSVLFANSQGISGDGNVVKETKTVDAFNAIEVFGPFSVTIRDGKNDSKVVVEADSNLHELIDIKTQDGTLAIRFAADKNLNTYEKLDVYVTAKNLSALKLSGSGTIKQSGTNSVDRFEISVSGSGTITTRTSGNEVVLDLSGTGGLNVSGNAENVAVKTSGTGNVNAKNLQTKRANVEASGSGSTDVHASDYAKVKASGVGSVVVHGNPAKLDSDVSPPGSVTKS